MIVNFRNIIVSFLTLILLGSCQDLKKSEKPKDLIPEAKMIDVLTEISLLHAARNYNKQKLENIGVDPDTYVYEKFDIDSMQFERSSNWYSEQYNQYEGIYDSVKARLQIMKTRLDSVRDIEIEIEDSIKQVKKDSIKALDSLKVDDSKKDFKVDSLKQEKFEESLKNRKDSLIAPPELTEDDSN
ncbi:DUF4296 domain-containing protein [Christiangramia forsetii]|uniref:DUF4296 domain-containing protein n=2 Tax=Christiangramia forsetii TaxID=411153 RepID=A0LXK4_CHRFK|nr:DUF4296 domain-containing protein [Christiangramia forsetii]GGG36610.1 hypothetical protein GCM10011532_20340 [Christiangramia forsetii]CAL65099.1 conserved hypothetical protein [Christiangramia forsetii KT0803]